VGWDGLEGAGPGWVVLTAVLTETPILLIDAAGVFVLWWGRDATTREACMTKSRRTRYVVVVLTPDGTMVPEVVGPYRDKARAEAEAERWERGNDDYVSQVRMLEHGPSLRRYLGIGR
jgi:hypothetical protein